MKKILSKLINFLNYPLLFISLGLIVMGILFTYNRLEKSLVEAIPIFLPFAFVIVMFVINMVYKKAKISENLLYNVVCFVVFISIIIVGVRSKFDTNMVLYYKYGINYNPSYLADNLSSVKVLLYCLGAANFFIILSTLLQNNENDKKPLKQDNTIKPIQENITNNIEIKDTKEEELL